MAEEPEVWRTLVAQFDTDCDGALNFIEFEALVASLLGGCRQYGTASQVAAEIGIPMDMRGHVHARMHAFMLPGSWVGFSGANALTPELLKQACSAVAGPFGPLQPALLAARDAAAAEIMASVLFGDPIEIVNVALLGHISAGKSTLLNALLGSQLLPTGSNETTFAVTEVRPMSHMVSSKLVIHRTSEVATSAPFPISGISGLKKRLWSRRCVPMRLRSLSPLPKKPVHSEKREQARIFMKLTHEPGET